MVNDLVGTKKILKVFYAKDSHYNLWFSLLIGEENVYLAGVDGPTFSGSFSQFKDHVYKSLDFSKCHYDDVQFINLREVKYEKN